MPKAAACDLGKPNSEKPTILSNTSFAVSSGTPFSTAPSRNRSQWPSSAERLRLRLIARRSDSASPVVKPASAIATSSTWSWNTTTPSVSASTSRSSGWSYGTS